MTPKELQVIKSRKINFCAKSNMAAGCRACIRVGIQRVKSTGSMWWSNILFFNCLPCLLFQWTSTFLSWGWCNFPKPAFWLSTFCTTLIGRYFLLLLSKGPPSPENFMIARSLQEYNSLQTPSWHFYLLPYYWPFQRWLPFWGGKVVDVNPHLPHHAYDYWAVKTQDVPCAMIRTS